MEPKQTNSLTIDKAKLTHVAAEFEQDIIAIAASMPSALAKVGTLRDAVKAEDWDAVCVLGDWFRDWLKMTHDTATTLTLVGSFAEIYQRQNDGDDIDGKANKDG